MANKIKLTANESKGLSTNKPSGFVGADVDAKKVKLIFKKATSKIDFAFYTHKGLNGSDTDYLIKREMILWLALQQGLISVKNAAQEFDTDKLVVDIEKGQYSKAK